MARIRSVHPSLFTDEAFMSVSPEARLLMIGLWTEADDNGIFEWKPVVIKARIFPGDMCDMVALLEELSKANVIRRIERAKPLGAIRNFCKFQRPKAPKTVWDIDDDIADFVSLSSRDEDQDTALRKRLVARSEGRCSYCKTEIVAASKRYNSVEIDHDIPVSRGGSDDEQNLVASCRTCNRSKGARTGSEFRQFLCERVSAKNGRATKASPTTHATSEVASLMEDGGWRREEEKLQPYPESASLEAARDDVTIRKRICRAYDQAGLPPPDTGRVAVWLKRGDDPEVIVATISGLLESGKKPGSLKYFDPIIAERMADSRKPRDGPRALKGSSAIAQALKELAHDRIIEPGSAVSRISQPG